VVVGRVQSGRDGHGHRGVSGFALGGLTPVLYERDVFFGHVRSSIPDEGRIAQGAHPVCRKTGPLGPFPQLISTCSLMRPCGIVSALPGVARTSARWVQLSAYGMYAFPRYRQVREASGNWQVFRPPRA